MPVHRSGIFAAGHEVLAAMQADSSGSCSMIYAHVRWRAGSFLALAFTAWLAVLSPWALASSARRSGGRYSQGAAYILSPYSAPRLQVSIRAGFRV